MSIIIIIGKRWKFVPKRFLSPPREFKYLYGSEVRQTTMENFFNVEKRVFPVVKVVKKEKIYIQSTIDKFFSSSKRVVHAVKAGKKEKKFFQTNLKKHLKKKN